MSREVVVQYVLAALETIPMVALYATLQRTKKPDVGFAAAAWICIFLSHVVAVVAGVLQAINISANELAGQFDYTLSFMSSTLLAASACKIAWPEVKADNLAQRLAEVVLPPIIGMIATGLNSYVSSIDDFTSVMAVGMLAFVAAQRSMRTNPAAAVTVGGLGITCSALQPLYHRLGDSPEFAMTLSLLGIGFGLSLAWARWDANEHPIATA